MELLIPIILLCVCANLDTLVMSISYHAQKRTISLTHNIFLSTVTTFGTWLFLLIGHLFSEQFPSWIPQRIGGILLFLMGIVMLIQYILHPSPTSQEAKPLTFSSLCFLAIALTLNNAGIGFAAGISGFSILLTTIFTFATTILCIEIGRFMGNHVFQQFLGKYSAPVSAFLLILLSVYECFF